jgi:hypothetical protein
MRFLGVALAIGLVAGSADAKTVVYTYQGKPLELVVPTVDEVGEEILQYLSLMPAVLEGARARIVVDRSKPNSSGINFEGVNYCGEDEDGNEIDADDCQFFGPAVRSFTTNYVSVPTHKWSVIQLTLGESTAEGFMDLDANRFGLSIGGNMDLHWRPLFTPDDLFPSFDVQYVSSGPGEWSVSAIPLPATAPLLIAAGGALILARRRRSKA